MNLGTILRFQIGDATAIRVVAENRYAFWVGVILVLLTGVARNYDQTWFGGSVMWLVGPLLFSVFSGTFLFLVLYRGFIRRHSVRAKTRAEDTFKHPEDAAVKSAWERLSLKGSEWKAERKETGRQEWEQWRRFMGLFWMTAPVAWLYAIPVERMMGSYQAAQANLGLLAVVSLWRVLLMSRVVSVVLQGISLVRATGWVSVAALLEVMVVLFGGAFFGPVFSGRILAGMSGMRNAPEENLILAALGNVLVGSIVALAVVLIALGVKRFAGTVQLFPEQRGRGFPLVGLILLTVIWAGMAYPEQRKQERFSNHAKLVEDQEYRKALDYLGRFTRSDFPASRRLEPNPYEYRVWKHLPSVVAELRSSDPEWVRRLYLDYVSAIFAHRSFRGEATEWARMFRAIGELPEGKEWVEKNRAELEKLVEEDRLNNLGSKDADKRVEEQEKVREALWKLGIEGEGK